MRPQSLEEYEGQAHLLGGGKLLARVMAGGRLPSLILWGPPGTGKTTLARIIARSSRADFAPLSAVQSGVKDIREVVARAEQRRDEMGIGTILFVDEIHRFSKAQQDALLPHVEAGTVVLIGATTENPSFEVNAALLSRCRVLRLEPLDDAAVGRCSTARWPTPSAASAVAGWCSRRRPASVLVARAQGDARRALNALEVAARTSATDGEHHRRRPWARPCSRVRCSTTRAARSTTTSSARSSRACAARIRTRPCTGWRACSRPARTRASCCAGW